MTTMNESPILPTGHSVLIRPTQVQEKTEAGVLMYSNSQEVEKEYLGQTEGTVVALGNTAYADQAAPFCKVGDVVIFPKWEGIMSKAKDGTQYRLIPDLAVKGIKVEGEGEGNE